MDDNKFAFDGQIKTIWDSIRFKFMMRRLRKIKQLLLWEAYMDKTFFLTHYKEQLSYNDSEDRQALAAENRKPLDQQDKVRILSIEDKIALASAVKQAYRKNENTIAELSKYINMIDEWWTNQS